MKKIMENEGSDSADCRSRWDQWRESSRSSCSSSSSMASAGKNSRSHSRSPSPPTPRSRRNASRLIPMASSGKKSRSRSRSSVPSAKSRSPSPMAVSCPSSPAQAYSSPTSRTVTSPKKGLPKKPKILSKIVPGTQLRHSERIAAMIKKRLAEDASRKSNGKKHATDKEKIIPKNPKKKISKVKPEKAVKRGRSFSKAVKRSSRKSKKFKPKKAVKRLQRPRKLC